MARTLVHEAASAGTAGPVRGLLDRMFAKAFDGLVYPQIWEDPDVDMQALAITPATRLIAIASGGCNVMSYLKAAPASVIAVDLNPAHIALLQLKRAAAKLLSHEEFASLFARPEKRRNLALYTQLRPHLDPVTRAWWEAWTLTNGRRFNLLAGNFQKQGLLGRFIGLGHLVVRLHGRNPARLLEARTMAEQRLLFEEVIGPVFRNPLVRLLARSPVAYFGLGIPPAQFDAMKHDASRSDDGATSLVELCRERVERLACDFPIDRNYFATQAFGRRYDAALPPYLEAANFAAVKAGAARVEPCLVSMTECLQAQPAAGLDAYVLLDAQDWMDERKITELWTQINRTAAAGARVIFRTAGAASPLEAMLPPELLAAWSYEAETSQALFRQDRSAIYGGFHLYRRTAG